MRNTLSPLQCNESCSASPSRRAIRLSGSSASRGSNTGDSTYDAIAPRNNATPVAEAGVAANKIKRRRNQVKKNHQHGKHDRRNGETWCKDSASGVGWAAQCSVTNAESSLAMRARGSWCLAEASPEIVPLGRVFPPFHIQQRETRYPFGHQQKHTQSDPG